MSPRRTLAAALVSIGLLSMAACGDDSGSSDAAFDAVTIKADSGKAPEVKFKEKLEPEKLATKVLVEGDGEKTKTGDTVSAQVWIGNGTTKKQVFSSHEAGGAQILTLEDGLIEGLKEALVDQKVGSVVAVAAPAKEAFGEQGNAQMNIGNGDSVLFITELVGQVPTEAKGTEKKPAAWAPKVTYKDGAVPTFDFAAAPKPTGKLQVTTLVEGDGAVVEKGQNLTVQYVGQVFGAKEPFDSSYSRQQPASFPIGTGGVVKGWDEALVGQKVGSRVIVQIPPKLGYPDGNEQAGIKKTDTIVFAIDLLAAS